MAITTYALLKTAIADWLNRQDLTSIIPTFISLAESDFQRSIRTRDMVQRSTATVNSQYTALPDDFLEQRYVQINDTVPYRLQYVTPQEMQDLRARAADVADKPKKYTIVGLDMEVQPTPDADYTAEIAYIQKIPALSDSNTSNWLLAAHPDLYLYSSLIHAAPYLRDDERVGLWQTAHDLIIGGIKEQEDRSRYQEGPLRVSMSAIGG